MELLPELFRTGRWLRLWHEASALVGTGRLRWRGVMANTFGPWCPPALWVWLNKMANGYALEVGNYTAVNPKRLAELDLPARASARQLDLSYRPWKDGLAMRLWCLHIVDPGNFRKGGLGGWQVDARDPTADVRLIEFCLSVPTEQFLRNGTLRALARHAFADRLPKQVLEETRRGLQVADWHEHLSAARDRMADEVDRLEACQAANTALDLPRLRQLITNWPSGGWERDEVVMPYRYALPHAISAGHFLRRALGSNR
jgi:asparagine synthase (glutamine-hydrolysing)